MSKKNMGKITDLLATMARLRDPDNGCPWDVEQTYDSLTAYTLEEAYEVIDAVDRKNMPDLKDELGDLLLQVIFYAQMASEDGHFDFSDVATNLNDKLIRRHPHVFGNKSADTSDDVVGIWDSVKKAEKENKTDDKEGFKSILDDVSLTQPSLMRIYELDKKAAKQGFDWDNLEGYFAVISEEMDEIRQSIADNESKEDLEMEVSDLLTATAVLARKLDINPERALQKGCTKFTKRFQYIEKQAFKAGKSLTDYDVDQMMEWWREYKLIEKNAA